MGYIKKEEEGHECLECGKELYGRPDKKFCNDSCRSRFYHRYHAAEQRMRRRVAAALDRNHEILSDLLEKGQDSASLVELEMIGFQPAYMTAHRKVDSQHADCSCYDLLYSLSSTRIYHLRRLDSTR